MMRGSPHWSIILIMLIVNLNIWMGLGGNLPGSEADGGMDFCRNDTDCQAPHICNMKNPDSPYCDCNPELHTWSTEMERCVGLANTPCSSNMSCISNSFCNYDGLCECNSSHSATSDNHCLLNYDFPCDDTNDELCNPELFLGCLKTTRKCGCKFPDAMKYEVAFEECRMLVDEPCGYANDVYHDCIQGAECVQLWPGSINSECQCEFGRIVDPITRTCLPSYQATCHTSTDCDVQNNMVCTIQNNGSGRCDCPVGMIWDEEDKACRVLAGESCNSINRCIDHATCSTLSNTCECDSGLMVHRRTRTCVPSYQSPCNITEPCNEESLLHCSFLSEIQLRQTGTCQCMEGHEWSEAQQHCISLIGSPCGEFQGCTQHAFCNQSELCECFPSYSRTPKNTCLLQYGSPCSGAGCNFYEFLECRRDECQCEEFALPEGGKCKSFVGGPCGLIERTMTSVECYFGTTCVLNSNSVTGTCHSTPSSKISNLRTSSITLLVLIVSSVLCILGIILYLIIIRRRRRRNNDHEVPH